MGPISDPIGGVGCQLVFPYYPNNGSAYRIAADTSLFVYDSEGHLLQANNRYARIRRQYTANGLITADTLIFGSYNNPTLNAEARRQLYSHDRNGRRTSMVGNTAVFLYQYSSFGPLQSVTDQASGNVYRLVYDPLSRVDSLVMGSGSVREKRTYDLDSRMIRRERLSGHPSVGQLYLDSLVYDRRGKVTIARMYSREQATQTARYTYEPHGAVVAQELTRDLGGYQVQEFRNDAYGNVFYQRTRSSAGGNDAPFVSTYGPDGLLMGRDAVLPSTPTQNQNEDDLLQTSFGSDVDIMSRLVREAPINGGAWIEQLAGRNYYSADNRLMVVQRYDAFLSPSVDLGTWEEYRYDALGRKIMTRARRDLNARPDTSHFLCSDPVNGSCGSYIERTVWDGDRILLEWRSPEGTPTGMNLGTVTYVHLEDFDHPVAIIRPDQQRAVNYTWRGLGESSVIALSGTSGDCTIPFGGCLAVDWPGKTQGGVYFTTNLLATGPNGPYNWFGTLADNGGGTSGLLYRRNRYFDVVTGRFTQQDPIGVAGGVNLYGFADGDPVNQTDPFGLMSCPPHCDEVFQLLGQWAPQMKQAMGLFAAGSVAGGTALAAAGGAGGAAMTTLTLTARAGGAATAVVSGLTSKASARQALSGLGLSAEQLKAAGSAISRGTGASTYDLIRQASGELFVHIYRPGRHGFQVMQSIISRSGSKSVTQYAIDAAGRVLVDPKHP